MEENVGDRQVNFPFFHFLFFLYLVRVIRVIRGSFLWDLAL
jgi:hypothetical protein